MSKPIRARREEFVERMWNIIPEYWKRGLFKAWHDDKNGNSLSESSEHVESYFKQLVFEVFDEIIPDQQDRLEKICTDCHGNIVRVDEMVECPDCDGLGEISMRIDDDPDIMDDEDCSVPVPCARCNGTGKVVRVDEAIGCPNCGGTGRITIGTPWFYGDAECARCGGTGKVTSDG